MPRRVVYTGYVRHSILWGRGVLECSPTVWSLSHFCFHSHFTRHPNAYFSFAASVSRESDSGLGEWEWVSERGREGEAAGSWISLKVANNGCNLHLKPRLYTELNTGPLVSWLVRVESAERCQSIDSRMPPWCVGTFHTKVALQVHLSFDREEMNASAPSRLSVTFLIISAICLPKRVWQDSWHLTVPRYWLHFTAVPTCTVSIFADHSECIAVALALICGGWEWAICVVPCLIILSFCLLIFDHI